MGGAYSGPNSALVSSKRPQMNYWHYHPEKRNRTTWLAKANAKLHQRCFKKIKEMSDDLTSGIRLGLLGIIVD